MTRRGWVRFPLLLDFFLARVKMAGYLLRTITPFFLNFVLISLSLKFSWAECQDIPFDRKILYEAIENSLEFMYPDGSFKPTHYTPQEIDAWVNFNIKILKSMD